jgi:ribosome maturation factor RimP
MENVEQIWKVVEPYLATERLELDDLELLGRGRARTLRVTVDRSGGIDLDRLSEVSRGLSRLLDNETELDGPYHLEVTSPGLERKLTRPSQFQKSVGREVVVKTSASTMRGLLTAASDDTLTLQPDDSDSLELSYDSVISARTVFRWERAPKPGSSGGKS